MDSERERASEGDKNMGRIMDNANLQCDFFLPKRALTPAATMDIEIKSKLKKRRLFSNCNNEDEYRSRFGLTPFPVGRMGPK